MSGRLGPRQGLVAFMAALAGPQPAAGWLELRHRRPGGGMRQRFFDARDPQAAAMAATVLSQTGDVYVGCAPRRERAGGRAAIERGWVLWVDCDDADSVDALGRFLPEPAMVVRTSASGRHAYWPLDRPLEVDALERANRRLAYALAADPACADGARILRPPATVSWKYEPPFPVTLERYTGERLDPGEVVDRLADPPGRPPRSARNVSRKAPAGDPLLSIEPANLPGGHDGSRGGPRRQAGLPISSGRYSVVARLSGPRVWLGVL